MLFSDWLAAQTNRDDPTGDLAKLCAGKSYPAHSFKQFAAWVRTQNSTGVVPGAACNSEDENRRGAVRAAEYAWGEFHNGNPATEFAWTQVFARRLGQMMTFLEHDYSKLTDDDRDYYSRHVENSIKPGNLLREISRYRFT